MLNRPVAEKADNAPEQITDESKFQSKEINGLTIKFAQHEGDDKNWVTLADEDHVHVEELTDGKTVEQLVADFAGHAAAVRAELDSMMQRVQRMMQNPQMASLMMTNPRLAIALAGLGDNVSVRVIGPEELAGMTAERAPSSPGTSRFGFMGASSPVMSPRSDSDLSPATPRFM